MTQRIFGWGFMQFFTALLADYGALADCEALADLWAPADCGALADLWALADCGALAGCGIW